MNINLLDEQQLSLLKTMLDNAHQVVMCCHKSPDGDAIGSSLALCRVLRNMGKNAVVIIPDQLPASLEFTVMGIDYVTFSFNEVKASNIIKNTQLILSLDYNTFSRVERMQPLLEQAQVPKVLIDHHLNPDTCFDVTISHPEMSSTSELVYRVVLQAQWERFIDLHAASELFVGIMTDTGNLAFSSSICSLVSSPLSIFFRRISKLPPS